MEWIHENEEPLADIAVDLAEIELGLLMMGGGAALFSGGLVLDVTLIGAVVGVPANAAGVGLMAVGAGATAHGAWNLGKDVKNLRMNNEASGSAPSGRSLEGAREKLVKDPANPGKSITDIDHIENEVLWEEKTAIGAGDANEWINKHVTRKLNSYVQARQHLPGYESAPIGIRFVRPGVETDFRSAVEGAVSKFRENSPDVDVRLEFPK